MARTQKRGNEVADESDGEPHAQMRGCESRDWHEEKMTLIKVVCYSRARGREVPPSMGLIVQACKRMRCAIVSLKIQLAVRGLRLASVRLCQRLVFFFLPPQTSKGCKSTNTTMHSFRLRN